MRTVLVVAALVTALEALTGSYAVAAQIPANDFYRPRPGEVYGPDTYCDWNRAGLPPHEMQVCLGRDRQNPPRLYRARPGEHPKPLLTNCQVGGPVSCNNDIYQPVWLRIIADNGETTKVDMNSIERLPGGGVSVITYSFAPGSRFDESRLQRLFFDCAGHYQGGNPPTESGDAPPRSVAGRIARAMCGRR